MLLMPNKKKIATLIVSGLGGSKKPDFVQKLGEESGTGEDKLPEAEEEADGVEASMEDFLRAVERKDAKAMARALKNALVMCGEESEVE